MKLTGIISVVLACIYSVSNVVGIGVIHCGCTHSQRMVMWSLHPACMCNESDEDCCAHNEHHENKDNDPEDFGCRDNDCCSLKYQFVDVDQLNATHCYDYFTKILSLFFFPLLSVHLLLDNMQQWDATIKNNSPPAGILKIPLIYMNRQLRL